MPRYNKFGLCMFLAISVVMLPQNASLKTRSIDGKSSLGIMQNVPPTSCWVETDCSAGEVCHMLIRVKGAPAGNS
jgi:hypothetical protein